MPSKIIKTDSLRLLLASLLSVIGMLVFSPLSVNAAPVDCSALSLSGTDMSKCQACNASGGTSFDDTTSACSDGGPAAQDQVTSLSEDVINIFSWVVGVASVIMIMVGGFKYITSQGDSGNITGAKNTILYAIIGLVVVMFSQIIVRFVIGKV